MHNANVLQQRIKILLTFFICALVASGLTAIPLQWEFKIIMPVIGNDSFNSSSFPTLSGWLEYINEGIQNGYGAFPFLAYGTDWLAFGHIAIAVAFIGPLRDPIRNIWVVEFGLIVCILIIPWTLIFGAIRDIPFFWQLVDMSFGVFGFLPLWFVRRYILVISAEKIKAQLE